MAKATPAGRAYERHVAERAMVTSAAERLVPTVAAAANLLVDVRYRERGIPEGLDPTAEILAECGEIFKGSRMRVGDIANALAQAISSLHAAYDYVSITETLENSQELFENPEKLLDALSIMERDDALLALTLLLVGRATTENLSPSYFTPSSFEGGRQASRFVYDVRPAIERVVGLGRPAPSSSSLDQAA